MGRANPILWERLKKKIVSQNVMGTAAGQWSARKAQLLVKEYKDRGGKFTGRKSTKNALHQWTLQDWRTKSGRPSHETGERYLPAKAIRALSSAEYARTTRKKRMAMKEGQQYSNQPASIAKKTRRYRRF
jgi:hypothetical protein